MDNPPINFVVKNANLSDPGVKASIFRYVRSRINTETKHVPITTFADLDNILKASYVICPKIIGTRSWIVFFKNGDTYYSVNFPKSDRKDCKIFALDIQVKPEIYLGTIMEGIHHKYMNEHYFIIDEIYYFEGRNILTKTKTDRLGQLSSAIQGKFMMSNNFRLCVSNHFNINSSSIAELYEKIVSDSNIQEIIFYPNIFGQKVYKYVILDTDTETKNTVVELCEFEMHRPENADVYRLFDLGTGEKIGIALIPDIETSKRCKEWFKKKSIKSLKVQFKLDQDKNKWIPIKQVEEI